MWAMANFEGSAATAVVLAGPSGRKEMSGVERSFWRASLSLGWVMEGITEDEEVGDARIL